jgi:hypothetical protein
VIVMCRKRQANDLDEVLNPSDHFDPDKRVGKDPRLSGPRSDESAVEPGDQDRRDDRPSARADEE